MCKLQELDLPSKSAPFRNAGEAVRGRGGAAVCAGRGRKPCRLGQEGISPQHGRLVAGRHPHDPQREVPAPGPVQGPPQQEGHRGLPEGPQVQAHLLLTSRDGSISKVLAKSCKIFHG